MRELFSLPRTDESISTQLNRAVHMMRAGWVVEYGKAIIGIPPEARAEYRDLIASGQGKHEQAYRQGGDNVLVFCGMPVVSQPDVDCIVVLSNASAKTSWPAKGSTTTPQVAGKLKPRLPVRAETGDGPAPPPRKTAWEYS